MSREYKVEVTVTPRLHGDDDYEVEERVGNIVGLRDEETYHQPGYLSWVGKATLGAGESELQCHQRLCAALPGRHVSTKWLYLERWDEEFSTDGFGPVEPLKNTDEEE